MIIPLPHNHRSLTLTSEDETHQNVKHVGLPVYVLFKLNIEHPHYYEMHQSCFSVV